MQIAQHEQAIANLKDQNDKLAVMNWESERLYAQALSNGIKQQEDFDKTNSESVLALKVMS